MVMMDQAGSGRVEMTWSVICCLVLEAFLLFFIVRCGWSDTPDATQDLLLAIFSNMFVIVCHFCPDFLCFC